jgi:hypothetical protein
MKRAFQSPSQFLIETFFSLINIWWVVLEMCAETRTCVLFDFHWNWNLSANSAKPPNNKLHESGFPVFIKTTITAVRRQVAFRSGHFAASEIAQSIHETGNWVDPRSGVDPIEKRNVCWSCRESNQVLSCPARNAATRKTTISRFFNHLKPRDNSTYHKL